MTEKEIRNTFMYHSADGNAIRAHEAIRTLITETAVTIANVLPESAERMLFLRHLQQAQMLANAAVAIHGLPEDSRSGGSAYWRLSNLCARVTGAAADPKTDEVEPKRVNAKQLGKAKKS